MRITATDEVAGVVRERGGTLYVWASSHRCCTGPLTFLEAGTAPPPGEARRFREVDAGGFIVLLDFGGRPVPEELVLELRGRRKRVVAFWNDRAWVG